MVLKRVGIFSVGKALGFLHAVLGLLIGGIFSLASLAGMAVAEGGAAGGAEANAVLMALGAGAIILFPIVYGIMGLVGGMILAVLYNVTATVVGGIELELDHDVGQPIE